MNNLFAWISVVFRYIFIIVIYFFLYEVIKLMIMDIKSQDFGDEGSYLKLINRRESLSFSIHEHYSLSENPFTIGRASSNVLPLKDNFVSKKHCEIIEDGGNYFLKDLDSSNGTFCNGNRLNDVVKLKNGDIIGIGQVSFLFVEGSSK